MELKLDFFYTEYITLRTYYEGGLGMEEWIDIAVDYLGYSQDQSLLIGAI
jgi:hypothetical protein